MFEAGILSPEGRKREEEEEEEVEDQETEKKEAVRLEKFWLFYARLLC